ncbi:MAG: aminotransferase class I/II-fold pyridoxal phosphate-dependent enzyme, partial [Marinirhabdus sp.]
MNKNKIWLSIPHMGGNELKYVQQAFDENWIAPLGPNVDAFEKDIQNYLKENVHVAALSSGTAAIHLALQLMGIGKGDEVLCQSMTFSASANPIVYQGATPVFIDSEPDTWNLSPDYLETAIKCVELYQWLARHFDNNYFQFDLEQLNHNKSLAIEKLNQMLSEKITQKCSSCGCKLPEDHRFNICEECFGERKLRRP